jgi:hypothetical protein
MALGHRISGLVMLAVALALPAQPAKGQSWFDWFNADAPASRSPASGYAISRPGPGSSFFSPFGGSFFAPYQADLNPLPQEDGPYRTLCVRMCDGYYFPISHATGASNLAHDAERCAASCGGDARLFYHPNPGGNIESMVDMTGRTYGSYPTAFKYRRALVAGCQCRPQPWVESEIARHRAYAMAEKATGKTEPAGTDGAVAADGDGSRRRPESDVEDFTAVPLASVRFGRNMQSGSNMDPIFGGIGSAGRTRASRSSYVPSAR